MTPPMNHFVARLGGRGCTREELLARIEAAAEAGCAAVSVPQACVRAEFAPEALAAEPRLLERERGEWPESFQLELAALARARGLAFMCAPGYPAAVAALAPHVDAFAIDSHWIPCPALLAAVARGRKPVTLATGMATLAEVRAAVDCLRQNGCSALTLLHAVSVRPTPSSEANLAAIETLRKTFGVATGWLDRTRDPAVIERAVRRFGATSIEFELELDARGTDPSRRHFWFPGEIAWTLQNLTRARPEELRRSHPADGDGRKEPRPLEAERCQWRADPGDGLRPTLALRRRLARDAVA